MAKKPDIVDLSLKFNGRLTPVNKKSIKKIVQHHMAHPTWTVQDVHHAHSDARRNGAGITAGIGYNFWIARDGTIYLGRGFNQGAHCRGHNSTTLGVGYQGNLQTQQMTDEQVAAGAALNAWLLQECGLKVSDIVGHGDLVATACPGQNFRMTAIKKLIQTGNVDTSKPIVSQPSKPAPSKSTPSKPKRNVSGDPYVRNIQQFVNSYGFSIAVDGIAGPQTMRGLVKVLQTELNKQFGRGLVVDGIFGPRTRAALVNVRAGARGNLTRVLQALLYIKGYDVGPFDGIFGGKTETAVRAFQRANRLTVDGIVGPQTWSALLG